jgi:hypothetical protein
VPEKTPDLTFDLSVRADVPDPALSRARIDPARMGPALGPLWTRLPEETRARLLAPSATGRPPTDSDQ